MIAPAFRFPFFLLIFAAFAETASARLTDNEAQAQARYGAPKPGLIGPDEKPLMAGAKEVIYSFEGWRIRAAYVNNATVRIEYAHLPEGTALKQISEAEAKAVLDAEKGTFTWREEKPRTGYKELNALKTLFDGRTWERSDHAVARLKANLLLVLETKDADTLEKKLAKAAGKAAPPPPAVPKF